MKKTFTVEDTAGLHARPASLLVQVASKYPNESSIIFNEKKITLKSIMAVMSLGIPHKSSFVIEVEGDDPELVMQGLEKVLKENDVI